MKIQRGGALTTPRGRAGGAREEVNAYSTSGICGIKNFYGGYKKYVFDGAVAVGVRYRQVRGRNDTNPPKEYGKMKLATMMKKAIDYFEQNKPEGASIFHFNGELYITKE